MNLRSKIGSMTLHSAWWTTRSRNGAAEIKRRLRSSRRKLVYVPG